MRCSLHKTPFSLRTKHTKVAGGIYIWLVYFYAFSHTPTYFAVGTEQVKETFQFKTTKLVPAAQLRWNCLSKCIKEITSQQSEGRHLTQIEIWAFHSGDDED